MTTSTVKSNLGIIVVVGSVWGLTEFAAGMGLQKCATLFTGAILTGVAFFWVSFIWSITRKLLPVLIIAGMAILFKLLDALLLPVAWNHGSILNPAYAFVTILFGFSLLILLFKNQFSTRLINRILLGAGAAIIVTAMFPLVRFATGSAACFYASTNIPLAVYTAPVAIVISMITVPLGYLAAGWYTGKIREENRIQTSLLSRLWSPAVLICSILIITLIRII
ncbi:MAG: hypothetical protein KAS82_00185 [Bacteroidales bacterium]|nr:hypothetical protein [Bacteroidales bacterium]